RAGQGVFAEIDALAAPDVQYVKPARIGVAELARHPGRVLAPTDEKSACVLRRGAAGVSRPLLYSPGLRVDISHLSLVVAATESAGSLWELRSAEASAAVSSRIRSTTLVRSRDITYHRTPSSGLCSSGSKSALRSRRSASAYITPSSENR